MDYTFNEQWQDYLDRWPRFLDKHEDSNFCKVNHPIFTVLMCYRQACFIESLSMDLERPIQIWKEQSKPKEYTLHFIVHLPYIELVEVEFYEHKYDTVPSDSWEYTFDVADETSIIEDTVTRTCDDVIPDSRLVVRLKTFTEYYLSKGFPESDTVTYDSDNHPVSSLYQHELCLDELGGLFNVPRLQFKPTTDYEHTYPAYNDQLTEDDYHYAQRIREYMSNYGKKSLPLLEILKQYRIDSSISNMKRKICHMTCTDRG